MTLYEKLDAYGKSDYYAFHMPGHKRNVNFMEENLPFGIDITEIEGFDDLHHCEGILKDAQTRAASVYGAEETHFLVNGSTVGILSALAGCTRRGDEVLIARNCHKSVYHAVEIFGMKPVYIYPKKQENEETQDNQDNKKISPSHAVRGFASKQFLRFSGEVERYIRDLAVPAIPPL